MYGHRCLSLKKILKYLLSELHLYFIRNLPSKYVKCNYCVFSQLIENVSLLVNDFYFFFNFQIKEKERLRRELEEEGEQWMATHQQQQEEIKEIEKRRVNLSHQTLLKYV